MNRVLGTCLLSLVAPATALVILILLERRGTVSSAEELEADERNAAEPTLKFMPRGK
jgi:hypothetical protein